MKDLAQGIDKPMIDPSMSREDRIREAAYRRFLARESGSGDDLTDWLEAEKEVDGHNPVASTSNVKSATTTRSPVRDEGAEDESPESASRSQEKTPTVSAPLKKRSSGRHRS